MATAPTLRHRTVVLLGDTDRHKLESLAKKEGVSAGEIVRRSLHSYGSRESASHAQDDALIEAAMDQIIAALHEAVASVERTDKRLDQFKKQLLANRTVAKPARKSK